MVLDAVSLLRNRLLCCALLCGGVFGCAQGSISQPASEKAAATPAKEVAAETPKTEAVSEAVAVIADLKRRQADIDAADQRAAEGARPPPRPLRSSMSTPLDRN